MSRPDLSPVALHKELEKIWATPPGWGRLAAVNHNILGKRFMLLALVFFAIGGILAMLIRAQLATPNGAFVGPELYGQIFTMHGTVMMFLFAIPLFEGLAMYMLPKLLGARDLAFPRLAAYGFWCYFFGGLILIVAMLAGYAPNAGWFMYTPLSSGAYSPGINADVWLLGITFVEISAVTAAIELIVTILKMRAPGMALTRMPVFAWYMLVTAGMMLIGFPPLILGSILLELERAFDLPFFDPTRGGDPLLWQHLFWLFGHPEVYIIFLPAAGVLSTLIPTFARRLLLGYNAIIVALVAMAFLSFGLWVHHMFTVGIPHLALAFFSAASALVAIPTAVQIFAWIGTLASGRPKFDVPMLYVVGFFIVFVCGGLTGVMLAMVPFNTQVHDTHFVVAHLHYVLVGGFVFPMLAGLYYWFPHFTGRRSVYALSVPAFWLILVGFNLTFFLMHLTGLMGMPRRISTYPSNWGWDWLNLLSSIGGFLMAMGFALVLIDLVMQLRFGRHTARNPWKARTLEWAMPIPPPAYNFAALPAIAGRADDVGVTALGRELAAGKGYLGFPRADRQETLGVDMMTGEPDQVIILPKPTFLPLWTALATGGVFLAFLSKLYWVAPIPALVVVVLFFLWTRPLGARRDMGPIDIGMGRAAPVAGEVKDNVTWWANLCGITADATLYAALLFGALYLALIAPGWTKPMPGVDWQPMAAMVAGFAGLFAVRRAGMLNAAGKSPANLLLVATVLGSMTTLLLLLGIVMVPEPTRHANLALRVALMTYCAVHALVAALLAFHALLRWRRGFISAIRATDMRITRAWTDYAAFAQLPTWALILLLAGAGA